MLLKRFGAKVTNFFGFVSKKIVIFAVRNTKRFDDAKDT